MPFSLDDKCNKYVLSRFGETREYIRRELDVLESVVEDKNANKLLKQLSERVRLIVNSKSGMFREDCTKHKSTYMSMIAKELDQLSTLYLWSDGYFLDSVAKTLKNLSKEFGYPLDKAA